MISYNHEDQNLSLIEGLNESLNATPLEHAYHVFGLRQENRPAVRIVKDGEDHPPLSVLRPLVGVFERSDIDLEIVDSEHDSYIGIGLRLDLRSNPKFAAAIVQTVVFAAEGRLIVQRGYVINGAKDVLKQPPSDHQPGVYRVRNTVFLLPAAHTGQNPQGPISKDCNGHSLVIRAIKNENENSIGETSNKAATAELFCRACGREWFAPIGMITKVSRSRSTAAATS